MTSFSERKVKRKLDRYWQGLRDIRKYFAPKTFDDIKRCAFGPRIRLEDKEIYLNEEAGLILNEFVDLISKTLGNADVLTDSTIFNACLNELEQDIARIYDTKTVIKIEDIVDNISTRLGQKLDTYVIFSALVGINIDDLNEIELGSSSIVKFTNDLKQGIIRDQYNLVAKDAEFYSNFIDKNLIDKVCFRHVITGDYDTAKRISRLLSREFLNYFRFIICFLANYSIHESPIRLRMEEEYISNGESFLALPSKSSTPVVSWGIGFQNLSPLLINLDRIKELKDNLFLNDYIAMVWAKERSHLDGIIINAIHWIGEAQNEIDFDAAFLKYWTSIEAVFTRRHKDNITENLAKSVSILIAFSDYQFIKIDDHNKIYRAVKDLYVIRSKIIHVGIRYRVTHKNLNEICKYASWVIASLFCLRSRGYSEMEQISEQIDRLHGIMKEEPNTK